MGFGVISYRTVAFASILFWTSCHCALPQAGAAPEANWRKDLLAWRELSIAARWIPYAPAKIEKIPTVLGTTIEMPVPGVAEFIVEGHTIRLEPVLESPKDTELFFILRYVHKTTLTGCLRFLHKHFRPGSDRTGRETQVASLVRTRPGRSPPNSLCNSCPRCLRSRAA